MKRFLVLTILSTFFCGVSLWCQTYKPRYYLGADVMLYKGTSVKVNEAYKSGFYKVFYDDFAYAKRSASVYVAYPLAKSEGMSMVDSLINRTFFVENIVDKNGDTLRSDYQTSRFERPILVLRDIQTNDTLYYKYDTSNELFFPFDVVLDLKEMNLCSRLKRSVNYATGDVQYAIPSLQGQGSISVNLTKKIATGQIPYYQIDIELNDPNLSFDEKRRGVIITFSDGRVWTQPYKIKADIYKDGFIYSVSMRLTVVDLFIFKTRNIRSVKLYEYEDIIFNGDSDKFKIYIDCLEKAG